jgi:hypothetical protein
MYYIGTKESCEAYNNIVLARQNREDDRENTKVIEHPNGVDFAVEKHPSVNAPFPQLVGRLNKDWFKKPKKTVKVKEPEVEEPKVEE